MVEVAIMVCLTLFQEIAPPTAIIKIKPEVDFQPSGQPAKSESE
jgi:hypothetical protein